MNGTELLEARQMVLEGATRAQVLAKYPELERYERTLRMIFDPLCNDEVLGELATALGSREQGDMVRLGKRLRESYGPK